MSTGSSRTSTCPVRRLPPRGGRRGARPAVGGGHRLRPARSRVVDPARRPPRRVADEPFRAAATAPGLHSAFDRPVGAGRWVPRTGSDVARPLPHADDTADAGCHIGASVAGPTGEMRLGLASRGRALLMLPVLRHGRTRRLHSDQGRFAPRPADPRRRHRRHPPTRSTGERGSSPGEQAMRAAPRLWTRRAFRTFPAQPDLLSGRVRPCGIVRAA
jgi:hypothetical protein